MSNLIIEKLLSKTKRNDLPNFVPGDTVRVQVKIKEGDKERLQALGRCYRPFARTAGQLHCTQDQLRSGRRAHLPSAFKGDRQSGSGALVEGSPRAAVLSAWASGQGRPPARRREDRRKGR